MGEEALQVVQVCLSFEAVWEGGTTLEHNLGNLRLLAGAGTQKQ